MERRLFQCPPAGGSHGKDAVFGNTKKHPDYVRVLFVQAPPIRLSGVLYRLWGSTGLLRWALRPACMLRCTSSSKALAARAMMGMVPASDGSAVYSAAARRISAISRR